MEKKRSDRPAKPSSHSGGKDSRPSGKSGFKSGGSGDRPKTGFKKGGPKKGGFDKGPRKSGGPSKGRGDFKGGKRDKRRDDRPVGDKQGQPARFMAWRLLTDVLGEGTSVLEHRAKFADVSGPDQARALGIVSDTLRNKSKIDAILERYLTKTPPPAVIAALNMATAELLLRGEAAHGAVDGAVTLLRNSQKLTHFAGLANAILRKVATDGPRHWEKLSDPVWPAKFRAAVAKVYGDDALAAMEKLTETAPPVDISVKEGDWAEQLGAETLPAGTLRLQDAGQVTAQPGFQEGAWWVQDWAAALPVRLMGDVTGKQVLDLCCAPGGKTLQLAAAGADVVGVDVQQSRMARVKENFARTGLNAKLTVADALEYTPKVTPDAVLLDAPCSASGTLRRHPDLPYLKEGWDLRPLLRLQARLMNKAAQMLEPGGMFLYVTCSLWPEEGEAQVEEFLKRQPRFKPDPIDPSDFDLPAEAAAPHGALRLRPDFWAGRGGMDGFYIARLIKG